MLSEQYVMVVKWNVVLYMTVPKIIAEYVEKKEKGMGIAENMSAKPQTNGNL
jgi:hypothetical protein